MTQKELIKNYLLSVGEPVTTKQIIEATGVNKGTLASIMSAYSGNGEVEIMDDGHPSGRKLYCWSGRCDSKIESGETQQEEAGAYYGMTESNTMRRDPATEIGTQKILLVNAHTVPKGASVTSAVLGSSPPFNPTEHSIRDALRLAHDALDNHRRTRKDPIEESLQMAVNALTLALSFDLNGGVKCS